MHVPTKTIAKSTYQLRNDAAKALGYTSYSARRRALASGVGLKGKDLVAARNAKRDHKAIYAARNARAQELGYDSYYAYRTATAA